MYNKYISIHVPRERHDNAFALIFPLMAISIHVPRERHDRDGRDNALHERQFQSTCPARGTTVLLLSAFI